MTLVILLVILVAVGIAAGAGYAIGSASRRPPRDLIAALRARDALIDDLRETAWDHREIDPHLSTIVIDKVRAATTTRKELS